MVNTKEILHFFYSQHFANGLRVSLGALIPALAGFYLGDLSVGIAISLGALISSIPDTPGPIAHRRNALLASLVLIFLATFLTQFINHNPLWFAIELVTLCFLFSMFAAWGTRAAAVGTSAMLMIFLNMQEPQGNQTALEYSLFVTLGAFWYTGLSLSLTQFMPYRLAQQELSEAIREVGAFIRIKAEFYDLNANTEESFKKLIDQQIIVSQHLDSLREILFKSKMIVKDSTSVGRTLILIFSDTIDLFEKTMSTQYDYTEIRAKFGSTAAFSEIRFTLIRLGNELDNFSYALAANRRPKPLFSLQKELEDLRQLIAQTSEESNETTFVLKKILINVRDMSQRVQTLYHYFSKGEIDRDRNIGDISKFISHEVFDFKSFRNNLSLKSDIFRHSLRLSIVLLIGFVLSKALNFGAHTNWILLTILVILKPGWSLTKERNFQRLVGTIIGGGVGILLLIWVHDPATRFVIMLVFMVLTYSLIRINYIISVMFMTPYLIIAFSFMGQDSMLIAQGRILATLIGCGLAFVSSYIIFPSWEGYHIHKNMHRLLIANYHYFVKVLETVAYRNLSETDYKLARKDVYVATANMAAAFQRMITEPKNKQKNAKGLHKFIVFNHLFTSHTADLINSVRMIPNEEIAGEPVRNFRKIQVKLEQLIKNFKSEDEEVVFEPTGVKIPELLLKDIRKNDETKFINGQALELRKVSNDLYRSSEMVLGYQLRRPD